jgi:nitroreductase
VKIDTFKKVEANIILNYHAIEKGFLHSKIRPQFGVFRIIELIKLLKSPYIVDQDIYKSQIQAAYLSLCKYYEYHIYINVDISRYFPENDYINFKEKCKLKNDIISNNECQKKIESNNDNFLLFSKSRKSIREYTGEKISIEKIYNVIELAKSAPSVCNRQPSKVYLMENKSKIDEIYKIQGGLGGFSEDISQLLVLTVDRSCFYSVGERNQMFIDGGIFLMNLLYSLHFYEIAACPAHWALNFEDDKKIEKIIQLSKSEKVICIISIGISQSEIKTTLSLRRDNNELLDIVY